MQQSKATGRGDRRGHPRLPLRAPVLLDLASDWARAPCRDLSVSGIAVELDRPLPLGTRVELYFELPSWVAVETTAVVARRDDDVVGLRFDALSPALARAISLYCDDLERSENATAVVLKLALPRRVRVS